jgi:peptidyl-dipeptidase Dcp
MANDGDFNPGIIDWQGPSGLPEFELAAETEFAPAFEAALASHLREIESIAGSGEPPDFANVIEAQELAGKALSRVSALFWVRAGAHTSDTIRKVERDMAPLLSRHYSAIAQNAALFARVEALWEKRRQRTETSGRNQRKAFGSLHAVQPECTGRRGGVVPSPEIG